MDARWNGEQAWAFRGTAVVAAVPDKPLLWSNVEGLAGQRIRVVQVFYPRPEPECAFTIDDRDGSGWAKVTEHGGSPRVGHRSVVVVPKSTEPDDWQDVLAIAIARTQATSCDTAGHAWRNDGAIPLVCDTCGHEDVAP